MMVSETPKSSNTFMQIKEFLGFSHSSSSSKTLHASSSFQSSHSPRPSSSSHGDVSESMMEENIINAEPIITKWDPESSSYYRITYIFHHDRNEAEEFLKSVQNLRRAMHFLVAENSTSSKLVLAQKLMQVAMRRLEKEFYQILSQNRQHLDPESVSSRSSCRSTNSPNDGEVQTDNGVEISGDSMTEEERVSAVAMSDLKSIADCMIDSGYGKECVKIYKVLRKSIIDETLYRLGTERFKSSRIQRMNWETLEHVIKNWMTTVKVVVSSLFHGERILCDHVFSRSATIRESCFSEVTKEGAITLFRFPELIAKGKKDSEKIFLLMELYEVNFEIWPDIESIFNSESTSTIKSQAQTSLLKLGDCIRSILSDFESTVQKDSSKTPVLGGGIHPLTISAMNFISSLGDYAVILSEIIPSEPQIPTSYLETLAMDGSMTSAVSTQLAWLILVLLCKLDSKAESYKDVSLSYLFLTNNLHYMVKKVSTTNLRNLLGEDWISNHMNKVKLYASNYESMAWYKVFSSLPERYLQETSPEEAKESFKRFNAAFQEAYKKQTSWTVDDGKLRDELKVSIANKLLPRYQEFYNEYIEMLRGEHDLNLFVRFSPDDLGNYLSDLFHGTSSSGSVSSSSSHSSQGCVPILSH